MGITIKTFRDLELIKEKGLKTLYPSRPRIMVGMASCGRAAGAKAIFDTFSEEMKKAGLDAIVTQNGCIGCCYKEPLVDVLEPGKPRLIYEKMTPEKALQLVKFLAEGEVRKEWVLAKIVEDFNIIEDKVISYTGDKPSTFVSVIRVRDRLTDTDTIHGHGKDTNGIPLYTELPFFSKQKRIAMRNCGFMDPDNIDEYIARGGYYALYKALKESSPEEITEEIIKSGLRGRGGAGFPTGLKWKFTRQSKGDTKYIICNADEGDPGAYMDRSILEGDPHSILEGMLIGAYAIGAKEGYIYVRAEYPLAVGKLAIAIKQAEQYGLIGENIFDSGFNFTTKLNKGAGAFVCGEETGLMASIEGKVGEPRQRPPFPAQKGLWGMPTNINNVETWANIPVIVARGGDWYSKIGTEKSKGTKVFSLVGEVKNIGLIEVPMGTTLREIIYDIGGGMGDDRDFKGVQTGGPSGGCIPKEFLDLPVDYESLTKAGAIMGSGGMVVMSDKVCMVDIAKYFLTFTSDESCGKCTPCRIGTQAMKNILTDITEGKGKESDMELLEELCLNVKTWSLCGLGQTAPNPILTTLRYYLEEYKAHIIDKKCPAGICKALIRYFIDAEKCTGCTLCAKSCPSEAIFGERRQVHNIDQRACIKCGVCFDICKFDAIRIE